MLGLYCHVVSCLLILTIAIKRKNCSKGSQVKNVFSRFRFRIRFRMLLSINTRQRYCVKLEVQHRFIYIDDYLRYFLKFVAT